MNVTTRNLCRFSPLGTRAIMLNALGGNPTSSAFSRGTSGTENYDAKFYILFAAPGGAIIAPWVKMVQFANRAWIIHCWPMPAGACSARAFPNGVVSSWNVGPA